MKNVIEIEMKLGKEIAPFVDDVGKIRLDLFKEYPYLYAGDLAGERKYLSLYTLDPHSILAIAKVNEQFAGISIGTPLLGKANLFPDAKQLFESIQLKAAECYYYGDVLILKPYRGLSIVTKFFHKQDVLIKSWGYKYACSMTVIREEDHPLKPKNYQSDDAIGKHFGYTKTAIKIKVNWPTMQPDYSVKNMDNELVFWVKKL